MRFKRRRHRRAVDDAVALRGDAGALQIVLDLRLHGRRLVGDQPALVAAERAAFVEQHGQRRLQRMGEVADLRARALDDALVVLDQRVGLVGERLDLGREAAVEPLRRALAHHAPARCAPGRSGCRPSRMATALMAIMPTPNSDEIGEQPALEAGDLVLQLGAVAHHAEARDAVLARRARTRSRTPRAPRRRCRRSCSCAGSRALNGTSVDRRRGDRPASSRSSAARRVSPPDTGSTDQYQPEFGSEKRRSPRSGLPVSAPAVGDADRADQVEQMRRQQAVEAALAGLAVERRDDGRR